MDYKLLIKEKYGSIYAFAKEKPGGLGRSTVYQVLSGRYAGNISNKLNIIEEFLQKKKEPKLLDLFYVNLLKIACSNCRSNKKRRRKCQKCKNLCKKQAEKLLEIKGF